MMQSFKIIVPSFNSVDYLEKTLTSIEMQSDHDYDVCVIDDASTLDKQREIIKTFCARNGWKSIFNQKNSGAMYNIVQSIPLFGCQDHDVILVVDGDDWLAHEDVLKHLRKIYQENDIYITWGQCEIYPAGQTPMKYAQPVPEMVIKQKLYRDIPFVFWHLKTFKYYLWRFLRDQDFRDSDGSYLQLMSDKAIMYPMLELAGEKIKFISETLYIYNLENPLNDYANTKPEEHMRVDTLIRNKPRYPTLPDLNV